MNELIVFFRELIHHHESKLGGSVIVNAIAIALREESEYLEEQGNYTRAMAFRNAAEAIESRK